MAGLGLLELGLELLGLALFPFLLPSLLFILSIIYFYRKYGIRKSSFHNML